MVHYIANSLQSYPLDHKDDARVAWTEEVMQDVCENHNNIDKNASFNIPKELFILIEKWAPEQQQTELLQPI